MKKIERMFAPSRRTIRVVLLLLLVSTAGCAGLDGGVFESENATETVTDAQDQQFRLVIQNEISSAQEVTVVLRADDGRTVLNESKSLQPGGGWVVSTFDVSSLETPVTITIDLPQRNESIEVSPIRSTTRGSRLHKITDDGLDHYECNVNVTCWKRFA